MALGTSLSGSEAHAFGHSDPFPRAWSQIVSCQSGALGDLLHPSLRAGPRDPPLKQAPCFQTTGLRSSPLRASLPQGITHLYWKYLLEAGDSGAAAVGPGPGAGRGGAELCPVHRTQPELQSSKKNRGHFSETRERRRNVGNSSGWSGVVGRVPMGCGGLARACGGLARAWGSGEVAPSR